MLYHQCTFRQKTENGMKITEGWIESKGAIPGAKVELKGEDGVWEVASAGFPGMELCKLLKLQNLNRKSLPSIMELK